VGAVLTVARSENWLLICKAETVLLPTALQAEANDESHVNPESVVPGNPTIGVKV
jgi:hypothetical protein